MKLLILALSGGIGGHDANELAQRETWAARLPSSIKIYWLKADAQLSQASIDEKQQIIFSPVQEVYENLLAKTVSALNTIPDLNNYSHVLRTNTSCYFAPELIEEQLENFSEINFYGGVEGNFLDRSKSRDPISYISGSGIWMSTDVAQEISKMKPLDFQGLVDDVAIGKHLSDIPRQMVSRQDITDFKALRPMAHNRVKHWKKDTITVRRMKALDDIYQSSSRQSLVENIKKFDEFEVNLSLRSLRTFGAMRKIHKTQSARIDEFLARLF